MSLTITVDIEPQVSSCKTDNLTALGKKSLSRVTSEPDLSDSGRSSFVSDNLFLYPGELLSDEEFSQEFSSSAPSRRSSADFVVSAADDDRDAAPSSSIPVPPPPPPLPGQLRSMFDLVGLDSPLHSRCLRRRSESILSLNSIPSSPSPSPHRLTHFRQLQVRNLVPIYALDHMLDNVQRICVGCGTYIYDLEVKLQECCSTIACSVCLSHTFSHVYSQENYDLLKESFDDFSLPCINPSCRLYLAYGDFNVSKNMVTCIVCFDEIPERKNKRKCCSEAVCKSCIQQIIRVNVEDEGNIHIVCPNPDCKAGVITQEEALKHLSGEAREKYQRLQLLECGEDGRKTCPNCCLITEHKLPGRFSRFKEDKVRITCSACQYAWCFRCHAPWHDNMSCRQFQRGDKQFKNWTKSKSTTGTANCQRCPLCQVYIQRSSGCDHMTCNRCKTEFCYKCGGFYNGLPGLGDHHEPTSIFGCKYNYKPNRPLQRKAVRGGYVAAKLAMLTGYPVLFVAGLAVVVVVGAVALPVYGGYKYYKYKKRTRKLYRRRRH